MTPIICQRDGWSAEWTSGDIGDKITDYCFITEIDRALQERQFICGKGSEYPYPDYTGASGVIASCVQKDASTIRITATDDGTGTLDWSTKFPGWPADYLPTGYNLELYPPDDGTPPGNKLGERAYGFVRGFGGGDFGNVSSGVGYIDITDDGFFTLNGLSLSDYVGWKYRVYRGGTPNLTTSGFGWTMKYPPHGNIGEVDYGTITSSTTSSITDNRVPTGDFSEGFQTPKSNYWPRIFATSKEAIFKVDGKWTRAAVSSLDLSTPASPKFLFAAQSAAPTGEYWLVEPGSYWRPEFRLRMQRCIGRAPWGVENALYLSQLSGDDFVFWSPIYDTTPPLGGCMAPWWMNDFYPYRADGGKKWNQLSVWNSTYTDKVDNTHGPDDDLVDNANPDFRGSTGLGKISESNGHPEPVEITTFDVPFANNFPESPPAPPDGTGVEINTYNPYFAWAIRGKQLLIQDTFAGAQWVEKKDYSNLKAIPALVQATWDDLYFDTTITTTITGIVGGGTDGDATLSVTMPTATFWQGPYTSLPVYWAVLKNDDVKASGTGTLTSSTLVADSYDFTNHPDPPTSDGDKDVGCEVVISFGRTRAFPRRVKYIVPPPVYFEPDVDEGGSPVFPPTGSGGDTGNGHGCALTYHVTISEGSSTASFDLTWDEGSGQWQDSFNGIYLSVSGGTADLAFTLDGLEWTSSVSGCPSGNVSDWTRVAGSATLVSIELVGLPTSGFPGSYIAIPASTHYEEYDQYGRLDDTGPAFIDGESAVYIADNFFDGPVEAWSELAWMGLPNVPSQSSFPRWEGAKLKGTVEAFENYTGGGWIGDSSQDWEVASTPMLSYTADAADSDGDSTHVHASQWSTDGGVTHLNPSSDGRFINSGRLDVLLPMIEASNDGGTTWVPRASTIYDTTTQTFTVSPAFPFSTGGCKLRFSEPGANSGGDHPGALGHIHRGWKLKLTKGDTSANVRITASFKNKVFYQGTVPFAVDNSCTYEIMKPRPGCVVHRRAGHPNAFGGWVLPEDALPGDRGQDWHLGDKGPFENAPTIVRGFGFFRRGDLSTNDTLWLEMMRSLDVLRWIRRDMGWSSRSPANFLSSTPELNTMGAGSGLLSGPVAPTYGADNDENSGIYCINIVKNDYTNWASLGLTGPSESDGSPPQMAWDNAELGPFQVVREYAYGIADTPTDQLACSISMYIAADVTEEPDDLGGGTRFNAYGSGLPGNGLLYHYDDLPPAAALHRRSSNAFPSTELSLPADPPNVVYGGVSPGDPYYPSGYPGGSSHLHDGFTITRQIAIEKFDVEGGLTYVTR